MSVIKWVSSSPTIRVGKNVQKTKSNPTWPGWLSPAYALAAMKIPEFYKRRIPYKLQILCDHFCQDIIVNFPNVCLFELGPGPTYGIAYIPKMVSPSSVLHTPLLTNNPSSPKSINTRSNESAGMRHV